LVRDQLYRRRKYKAKLDGTVTELRTDAYRDTQVALHTAITTLLVEKEIRAKEDILEPAGVPTSEIPFYLNSMREFCKCCRNFTSITKDNKCYDILCRYRDKGLQVNLLYQLAALCGCYPAGYGYYV